MSEAKVWIDPRIKTLDWEKMNALIPAVVQHFASGEVLMLGYMNQDALAQTCDRGKVTFFSRSKQRLWTKGETSGNGLVLKSIHVDCDGDTLLILADPQGPTCHQGTLTCFGEQTAPKQAFLGKLDRLVATRKQTAPEGSYTRELFQSGTRRIAQKVGEEGVETALAAVAQDDAAFLGESADLLYHLLVLLHARGLALSDTVDELQKRHASG